MSSGHELQYIGQEEQASSPADQAPSLDTAQLIALLVQERQSGIIDSEEYVRRRMLLELDVLQTRMPHRLNSARRVGAFIRTLHSLSYTS